MVNIMAKDGTYMELDSHWLSDDNAAPTERRDQATFGQASGCNQNSGES
jgi:hypothetical protein